MSVIRKTCRSFNGKRPEILVVVHEMELHAGQIADIAAGRADANRGAGGRGRGRGRRSSARRPPTAQPLPAGMVQQRTERNPRESPAAGTDAQDLTYG